MEQQVKNTTNKRRWQQIDYSIRQKIEILAKAKLKAAEIAKLLGYSKRTIERELKRGKTTQRHIKKDPLAQFAPSDREYIVSHYYSADIAQQDCDSKATAKGTQVKLGQSYYFCELLAKYIKQGYSPYSALMLIRNDRETHERCGLQICLKTLYNYIHRDYIPGITTADLPEQGKPRKRNYNRVRLALNNLKGRSIEERPPEIAQRTSFGHWEMDSVEGKAGTKAALLVLTERLTRQEFIFKMTSKSQKEVVRLLDELETRLGKRRFKKIFKTITCDNGCEFLGQAALEKSIGKGNRTTIYYCHPYSAYERGTNENINRMIRRFIPKGTDISKYTPKQIRQIQDHINSTPRLILEGYPSNIRFRQYLA